MDMKPFPEIETERLYIRQLTLADRESVFKHFADPEIARFMDIEPCRDVKKAEEIIQFHMDDSGCRYGLFNKVNNHFLGTVGFHCWANSEPSSAELGFDLSRSYWGQGLMQEALMEIIKMGWDVMNLDFIEATVEQANIRSQNLLVKMLFSKADELKGDLFYYTLNREEFIL
ncbi:GNAT family N-acetyltransferase [Paenibacillus pabuli]|uniref:GNAT family N-acetyltransferase n=1 Tax=Paenibacillus pabuli TaxID=1472 RepID=UPI000B07CFA3|nr:GNAT family N-acetyltransferase [Paenibacillus pabuli]